MSTFYLELAIRVLRLANALQYENAINLLRLALSAEGEVDHAPEALRSIDVDLQFCWDVEIRLNGEPDHEKFTEAIAALEAWVDAQ